MRSLVVNRMNVITRPATSRFDFSRLQGSQFDQIVIAGKEGNKKDWDRNRYRRKQAHFAYERYITVCIRIIQDADGFLFIKNYGVLAQLGERLICNQKVAGSSPVRSTYAELNESGESASLTRKKLGVRFSQSVLDHQSNGQNTSLRTKRYRFDSYMVY